jgi:hypothetical protein
MNQLRGFMHNNIVTVAVSAAKREIIAALWAGNPNSHF